MVQGRADQAVELKVHKSSNIGVTRGLMACLKSRVWLNDEVMNLLVGLLQVCRLLRVNSTIRSPALQCNAPAWV